ncbi:hypothetical protein CHUAL_007520 [Chamberlinius hualienensis]
MPSSKVVKSSVGGQKYNATVLKVIILGDGGVGKTCLISRFVNNKFDSCSFHTIGVEFLNKEIDVNGSKFTLQIWDTAGQERFKSLRTPFYRGSDICVLTYAIDDKQSFNNLALWKKEFLYYAGVDENVSFPFLVVGNKVDVDEDQRAVSLEEVEEWCRENGNVLHIETSAKDATNVDVAFSLAVECWLKMEETFEKPFSGDTVQLTNAKPSQRSCCWTI